MNVGLVVVAEGFALPDQADTMQLTDVLRYARRFQRVELEVPLPRLGSTSHREALSRLVVDLVDVDQAASLVRTSLEIPPAVGLRLLEASLGLLP